MSGTKKILVCLPDELLETVDLITTDDKMNRSQVVREAMRLYITERHKRLNRERMIYGYQEMASINSDIAEECYCADCEILCNYEKRLREME